MRIRWTQHPTDPTLNGTTVHVSRAAADVFITLKQAVIEPYRGYVDFLSSTAPTGNDPSNVNSSVVGAPLAGDILAETFPDDATHQTVSEHLSGRPARRSSHRRSACAPS
jgi:hypothetical protein